jgi:hypothetical protein
MSPNPSFQTVRLSRGRHLSPTDGACVMELASMLADERFTDHPSSVCPVVAMVLRAYNDGIDDERRQDLYAYAAACVGTRDRRARTARLRRCEEFFGESRRRRMLLRRSRMHAIGRAALECGRGADDARHTAFLALVDELIGGNPRVPEETPRNVAA